MFDDKINNNHPAGLPMDDNEPKKELPLQSPQVEDIFGTTEIPPPQAAPVIPPPAPASQYNYNDPNLFGKQMSFKRPLLLALTGILALALIVGLIFGFITLIRSVKKPNIVLPKIENNTKTPATNQPQNNNSNNNLVTTSTSVVIDSDADGISDEDEKKYKTNVNDFDSDRDGLSDGAEIKIFHTDPLNNDSDGDSYEDGDEVINGYDPNKVKGKLFGTTTPN